MSFVDVDAVIETVNEQFANYDDFYDQHYQLSAKPHSRNNGNPLYILQLKPNSPTFNLVLHPDETFELILPLSQIGMELHPTASQRELNRIMVLQWNQYAIDKAMRLVETKLDDVYLCDTKVNDTEDIIYSETNHQLVVACVVIMYLFVKIDMQIKHQL